MQRDLLVQPQLKVFPYQNYMCLESLQGRGERGVEKSGHFRPRASSIFIVYLVQSIPTAKCSCKHKQFWNFRFGGSREALLPPERVSPGTAKGILYLQQWECENVYSIETLHSLPKLECHFIDFVVRTLGSKSLGVKAGIWVKLIWAGPLIGL